MVEASAGNVGAFEIRGWASRGRNRETIPFCKDLNAIRIVIFS
jgi:hypothetical protein